MENFRKRYGTADYKQSNSAKTSTNRKLETRYNSYRFKTIQFFDQNYLQLPNLQQYLIEREQNISATTYNGSRSILVLNDINIDETLQLPQFDEL